MTINAYDERFTLTGPDGSTVEIFRDGERVEWTGYVNATDRRGNGIGGSETWTNPSVAALRIIADLAAEGGYRLTGHDGHPDLEDPDYEEADGDES